ncbi:MAG: Disulfide-bond oxidoreductase YfcG [Alphaproteobacteria bacterium MarineAlpha10_Bin1]|nr:MAG: Disulfide-bond oxidoreductase YfcG [Alphaproteobacteria bacterium MarineAlpha10_Bin1]
MYVLYHYPYSQHARRVVALLEEAKLAYELRHVAMDKGEHMSPAYLALNPNHQVPTLIDGALTLFESNAILRYLCVKHDLDDWCPVELASRAAVEQWLDWNQCRLSPSVIDVVLNKAFLGDQGDPAAIQRGEEKLAELLPVLDAELVSKKFLAGAQPSIADLSVASNITHLSFAAAEPKQENVTAWLRRVCAIEGFKKTLLQ